MSVLIVDDASTEPMPQDWPGQNFSALDSVEVLHLRSNQGHQRAIALGLYHLHEFTDAEAVVVMDGDGEDRPEDLPELLRAFSPVARPARAATWCSPRGPSAWRVWASGCAIGRIVWSIAR